MAALMLAGCGNAEDAAEKKAQSILAVGAAEARAGWQRGLAAPPVPDTLEAEIACTLHWEAWGMAIDDGRLVERVMAAMPPEIQRKPAFETHGRWSEKALSRQDAEGGDPGPIIEATTRLRPGIDAEFNRAFSGKPGALANYVAKLAACRTL